MDLIDDEQGLDLDSNEPALFVVIPQGLSPNESGEFQTPKAQENYELLFEICEMEYGLTPYEMEDIALAFTGAKEKIKKAKETLDSLNFPYTYKQTSPAILVKEINAQQLAAYETQAKECQSFMGQPFNNDSDLIAIVMPYPVNFIDKAYSSPNPMQLMDTFYQMASEQDPGLQEFHAQVSAYAKEHGLNHSILSSDESIIFGDAEKIKAARAHYHPDFVTRVSDIAQFAMDQQTIQNSLEQDNSGSTAALNSPRNLN
tara:strand:- start:22508 stop:23281 length:774 start_codon:yes stop_codon:yes gene_type:complete